MEATVTREFDVSHLSRTCSVDPPAQLHWEQLDRLKKWLIAERLSRKDHSVDDIEVTLPDGDDDADGGSELDERGTGAGTSVEA